jgi:hypothetical protein
VNIKFEGTLTKDDFNATVKLANRPILKTNGVHIDFWVTLTSFGLILIVIGLQILFTNGNTGFGALVLVVGAVFFVLGLKTRNAINRAWEQFQTTDMKREGVITDDYLELRSAISSSQTQWSGFSGYGEIEDGIVLFQNVVAYSFPARFFQNQADWQSFREFVSHRLPMTHKVESGRMRVSSRIVWLILLLSVATMILLKYLQDTK